MTEARILTPDEYGPGSEIEERLNKATPGPWVADGRWVHPLGRQAHYVAECRKVTDAAAIAHAPETERNLLATLRSRDEELAKKDRRIEELAEEATSYLEHAAEAQPRLRKAVQDAKVAVCVEVRERLLELNERSMPSDDPEVALEHVAELVQAIEAEVIHD